MTKVCNKCYQRKDISEFYKRKNSKDSLRSQCKLCYKKSIDRDKKKVSNKIYRLKNKIKLKQYRSKNKKRSNELRNKRYLMKKLEAINYKGGKCSICGYDKCIQALEFHHLYPNEKESDISILIQKNKDFKLIKRELDKCILLCSNCHREIHYNINIGGNND